MNPILFPFILMVGYILKLRMGELNYKLNYIGLPQTEVQSTGNLLDSQGRLIERGWSTQPLKIFNIKQIDQLTRSLRLKQWNYYHFATSDVYFGIAFADVGYGSNIMITFYDTKSDTFIKKDIMLLPILHSKLDLNADPQELNWKYDLEGDVTIHYKEHQSHETEYRSLQVKCSGLEVDIQFTNKQTDDSIVVYVPINEAGNQFFYNMKSYNWDVKGRFSLNEHVHQISGNGGQDWGRGVWNYDTFWLWMSGLGQTTTGQHIGINLGGGFQDVTAPATEESIIVGSKLHKLKDLEYHYDEQDYKAPILVISHGYKKEDFHKSASKLKNGAFYCEFIPSVRNVNARELLVISTHMTQFIGVYNGAYVNGNVVITFQNVLGITEFNKSKF